MNNTNTINAAETNLETTSANARRLAVQNHVAAFVYQTGPDTFNFCFVAHNPACGVLVARYDATGKSF